jgi:PAS domain S-box-containing protein
MSTRIVSAGASVRVGGAEQHGERSAQQRADVDARMPWMDWGDLGVSDHVMLAYEEDAHLLDTVSHFAATGLAAGEATVVIATPPHREQLEARLCAQGVDLASARLQGQYVPVDAAETLAQVMSNGWPDAERFADVVGGIIACAGSRYPRVRAFGEMVALLWVAGHEDAALRVEALWHDLIHTYTFPLLCAYPMPGFARRAHTSQFLTICAAHSHVIPTESYPALASPNERLRAIVQLQQQAHTLESEIAERQALEQALRRSAQELADFFDNAPMGLCWVGADGIILRVNQAELNLLGYSQDEYLGHHIAAFHADPSVSADFLRRLHAGEELHDYEAHLVCKDGTIKEVLLDANVLWEQGQFIHARCFTRDITANKRAAEIRERLAAIVDSSDDAIIGHTLEGVITSWNQGAEQLYGYTAAEVLGQLLTLLIPPDLPDDLPQLLARLQRGERIEHYETRRLHKDGTQRDVSLTISPIHEHTGRIIGASKIARDITERKRSEQALQQAYAELEQRVEERTAALQREMAERQHAEVQLRQQEALLFQHEKLAAMGTLLANVAHELNNPLAVIMMHADLLHEERQNDAQVEPVQAIMQAAERCMRIVRNFLTLARQHPPERQTVALNTVIEGAMELLAYGLEVDTITVDWQLTDDLPLLWADPHQLHQVVVNLVTNAHQALREVLLPRSLTLTTRYDPVGACVILEVADTGPGIPPALQTRIFEPFFTTKPPGVGTGLGLPLCRGIIEGHGGSISVESQAGQGTVFRLTLPVQAAVHAGGVPQRTDAVPPAPGAAKTILVVDDEASITRALAHLLRRDGHTVDTAANGRLALSKLHTQAYDLLLCDLRMPELDGPGLYQALQHEHPYYLARVIFLTGDTLSPEARTFLEQVRVPRLSKPFRAAEVRQLIHQVLQETPG